MWRTYLLGSARITEVLDNDLRSHGLDLGEYQILMCLEEAPDRSLRMSQLAERVHQSRSRLTHAISRLEGRGLVSRQRSQRDGRGVYATLTPEGFALLEKAAPSHVEAVRRIFVESVAPEDFSALGRAFDDVLNVEEQL